MGNKWCSFLNLLKIQTVLKPQKRRMPLWLGMFEWILQELNELLFLIITQAPLWFGPRGLTSTSFSSDISQIELAQVQVQAGRRHNKCSSSLWCTHCMDVIMIMWMRKTAFSMSTGKALCVYNKLNSSSSGLQMLLKNLMESFLLSHFQNKQHTSFRKLTE
jgi:hypothetical protein